MCSVDQLPILVMHYNNAVQSKLGQLNESRCDPWITLLLAFVIWCTSIKLYWRMLWICKFIVTSCRQNACLGTFTNNSWVLGYWVYKTWAYTEDNISDSRKRAEAAVTVLFACCASKPDIGWWCQKPFKSLCDFLLWQQVKTLTLCCVNQRKTWIVLTKCWADSNCNRLMGTITGVCSCVFVETVVGESVVVIKKLLQMQVWVLSSIVNCVLSLPCSFMFVLVSVLGALDVSDAQKTAFSA